MVQFRAESHATKRRLLPSRHANRQEWMNFFWFFLRTLYQAPLTHEEWVNGAWYKPLFGAPPPANPVRNTKRPNDWKSQSFGRLV